MTRASPIEIDNLLANSLGDILGLFGIIFSRIYPTSPGYRGLLRVVSTRILHNGCVLKSARSISIVKVDKLSLSLSIETSENDGFAIPSFVWRVSLSCFNSSVPSFFFPATISVQQSIILPKGFFYYKASGNNILSKSIQEALTI